MFGILNLQTALKECIFGILNLQTALKECIFKILNLEFKFYLILIGNHSKVLDSLNREQYAGIWLNLKT